MLPFNYVGSPVIIAGEVDERVKRRLLHVYGDGVKFVKGLSDEDGRYHFWTPHEENEDDLFWLMRRLIEDTEFRHVFSGSNNALSPEALTQSSAVLSPQPNVSGL